MTDNAKGSITGITPKVARASSNRSQDIEPLNGYGGLPQQLMDHAQGYYKDGHGQILPSGVVFIPNPYQGGGQASHNIQDLVPPGGKFVLAGNGGVYVQIPPNNPWWQHHPEYQQAAAGGVNVTGQNQAAYDQNQIDTGVANYNQSVHDFYNGGNQTLNGVDQSTTDPLGINGSSAQTGANGSFNTKTGHNKDGSWSVTAGDGKTNLTDSTFGQQQVAAQVGQSVLSALGNGYSNLGSTSVLFSQGAGGLTPQGTQTVRTANGFITQNKQDNRQDLVPGARGQYQNQPMNSAQQQGQAQYMTLGNAMGWFARLSVDDKDAYNALVGQLNRAGYFAPQSGNMNYLPDNQLPLNTYSKNAGLAMAEALQDLAVAQSAGEKSDMATWLQKRGQGYEDYVKAGAGYNPVNRSYQDPATLALTAKSAAQNAIGRNLTPAEEAKFEAAFRGKENAAYNEMDQYGRAKAQANLTGASGLAAGTPTGYTAPDTSGEADQYLNQNPQFGAEKQGYQSLELAKGLVQFLKGGAV